MKKLMALIFISVSALVITSCGTSTKKPSVEEGGSSQDTPGNADKEEAAGVDDREIGIAPGLLAPDFTLLGREGEEITLSDYKGKITFLNFWATTCPYCVEEMPDLEAFYNNHKDEDDVALVGINMTKTWEKQSKEDLIEWLDEEGLTFPVAFDVDGEQASQWAARSLPMTFVIDEEGTSLGKIVGKTDIKTLEGILEEVRVARDEK